MYKYIFTILVLSPVTLLAMGDKPEDTKPVKIIVESQELCDPQEETEMPRFY